MAFSGTTCPTSWSEYLPARGRFLRGIDNGAGNDPDCTARTGWCTVGSVQADGFKSHNHEQDWTTMYNYSPGYFLLANWAYASIEIGAHIHAMTSSTGWLETRPKNVAVLFCIKN